MDNATLKYHARKRPKFYWKQDEEPQPNWLEHAIDIFFTKLTTKLNSKWERIPKMGWGNCMLNKHVCRNCKCTFWTERKEEDICDSKECFIKHNGSN